MEEELEIFFVGYEGDIRKAIKNQVYLDIGEASRVWHRAANIVGLDGIRIFRAKLIVDWEPVYPDDYKLLKSM